MTFMAQDSAGRVCGLRSNTCYAVCLAYSATLLCNSAGVVVRYPNHLVHLQAVISLQQAGRDNLSMPENSVVLDFQ